jgi:transposase
VAVYCGIDWAEGHHDIALVNDDGKLIAKRRINETPDGIAELTAMLAAAGDSEAEPIPVAIETPRGLLIAPPAGRSIRSTRWRWPGIESGRRSQARRAIMSMRWR